MNRFLQQKGFTLVELAVTLVIMGLILGGLVAPISDGFKNAQSRNTGDKMMAAKEAIIGFAIKNKRLPCPTNVWTGSGAGEEPADCNTKTVISATVGTRTSSGVLKGIIPWNTLGISRDDAFGNPIYYAVERRLTIDSDSGNTGNDFFRELAINNANVTNITINGYDESNGNRGIELAKYVAFVIISLGKTNSAVTPSATNTTYINTLVGSEKSNAQGCCETLPFKNTTTSTVFYSRIVNENKALKDSAGTTIGAYDDQVIWVPFYQLIGIMTQANRLQ